jgi:hypothetical protein
MAVVAALSALSAAGYRAYVADQASVVPIATTQSYVDLDSADAGPRTRHSVTSPATTVAVKADDVIGTTHGRVQAVPAGQAAPAGTQMTPRALNDSEPPAKGLAGNGGTGRSQHVIVAAQVLAQDRGTRVVS